jgi:hypothetical protein
MTRLILVLFFAIVGAQAQSLVWASLAGQTIQSVTPADSSSCNPTGTLFSQSCTSTGLPYPWHTDGGAVVSAWNGGVGVTKAGDEHMLIWGGGHSDYPGTQIYSLNLAGGANTMTLLTNPSYVNATDYANCSNVYLSGARRAVHNFAQPVYMPNIHMVHLFSGSVWYCGSHFDDTWLMNPDTGAETSYDPVNCGSGCVYNTVGKPQSYFTGAVISGLAPFVDEAYDPNTGTDFLLSETGWLLQYTPPNITGSPCVADTSTCNQYIYAGGYSLSMLCYSTSGCMTAFVDSSRKKFWLYGGGNAYQWDISPTSLAAMLAGTLLPYTNQTSSIDSSCSALLNAQAPGLQYNAVTDKLVGYVEQTGAQIITMNLSTFVCTTSTPSGATPANGTNPDGMFGRFQYFPTLGTYAMVNDWNVAPALLQPAATPAITTTTLANGSTLASYSATIATTGTPTPTCAVTSGALPAGLSISSGCAISGTPSAAGLASFTVTATNAAGSASQAYTINVTGSGPSSIGTGKVVGSGGVIIHQREYR